MIVIVNELDCKRIFLFFIIYKGRYKMDKNEKQCGDFEKQFIKDQLIQSAKNAALKGISSEVFEALLISLSDELNFKDIMSKVSKEQVQ